MYYVGSTIRIQNQKKSLQMRPDPYPDPQSGFPKLSVIENNFKMELHTLTGESDEQCCGAGPFSVGSGFSSRFWLRLQVWLKV